MAWQSTSSGTGADNSKMMSPVATWNGSSRKVRLIATALTAGAAIFAISAGISAAWEIVGLPKIATQAHVSEQITLQIAPIVRNLSDLKDQLFLASREAAAAHRSQVDREIFDWQIKRPDVRDATLQHMIDDRVRMLSLERDNIDHKLETMHP